MTPEYAAGFFDGEGCVNCSTNKGGSPFIRVLVVNTNIDVLEHLQEKWGGDINKNYKPKQEWKQAYTWRLSHSAALKFMKEIEPFVIVKKTQVQAALHFGTIRPGKGQRWSEDAKEKAKTLIDSIKNANRKGTTV